jgi:heterodisulfide reductase subunit A
MHQDIIVIGAGVAGMEASAQLSAKGYSVALLEKQLNLGGNVAKWDKLFPIIRPAKEVLEHIRNGMNSSIKIITGETVTDVNRIGNIFAVQISNGETLTSDAVLVTTGYKMFDAHRKEEYGYGIYDNVITSADFERMIGLQNKITTQQGTKPARIGFVHCVGSRDVKVGNPYCSRVCCVTAVKQAIEAKHLLPNCEVFCFYMDLRMFGRHFETLYREAQELGVQFIRGRISEAAEVINGGVQIKTEDTLAGRPLKLTVDLLVLMVGMEAGEEAPMLAKSMHINLGVDRFFMPPDEQVKNNVSGVSGIFMAGTCTFPKSITETLADARAAASQIDAYLYSKQTVAQS